MSDPPGGARQGLPTATLFAYGISDFRVMLAGMPLMLYLNIYYATEVGIGLVGLGNLLLFARIFDLATDPLVGYLSDHTRTRWGRRKPWMVASLPFMMLGLYKVLIPAEGAGLGYVFSWMMVMWLGWTMLMIPYCAWGAELTTDYDERTRVTGWRAAMGSVGQLTSITFPVVAAVWFSLDGISGIMHITAYAAMILIPIAVLITVTRVKEVPDLSAPAMQVFDGLKVMLRNGSFRWLVIAFMISSLGLAIMTSSRLAMGRALLGCVSVRVPGEPYPRAGGQAPHAVLAVEPDFALGDGLGSLAREQNDATAGADRIAIEDGLGKLGSHPSDTSGPRPGEQHVDHVAQVDGALVQEPPLEAHGTRNVAIPMDGERIAEDRGHGLHAFGRDRVHPERRDGVSDSHLHAVSPAAAIRQKCQRNATSAMRAPASSSSAIS